MTLDQLGVLEGDCNCDIGHMTRPATWDDLKELGEEVWWCDLKGEAWESEIHEGTPCDEENRLYGWQNHKSCGPAILITSRES